MTTTSQPSGSLLLIHSHYGEPPGLFKLALERGDAVIIRERELTAEHFARARGLITTSHLDQLGFMAWSGAAGALLARGGRWFFNGHFLRPLLPGLNLYRPIVKARRADLVLTRLHDHPVFTGIEQASFEENNGVAGFYGRGHNPLPEGATAINGLGPDRLPIDWEWTPAGGGRLFSHAGNDLGGMGGPNPSHALVAPRIIAWTAGELSA